MFFVWNDGQKIQSGLDKAGVVSTTLNEREGFFGLIGLTRFG